MTSTLGGDVRPRGWRDGAAWRCGTGGRACAAPGGCEAGRRVSVHRFSRGQRSLRPYDRPDGPSPRQRNAPRYRRSRSALACSPRCSGAGAAHQTLAWLQRKPSLPNGPGAYHDGSRGPSRVRAAERIRPLGRITRHLLTCRSSPAALSPRRSTSLAGWGHPFGEGLLPARLAGAVRGRGRAGQESSSRRSSRAGWPGGSLSSPATTPSTSTSLGYVPRDKAGSVRAVRRRDATVRGVRATMKRRAATVAPERRPRKRWRSRAG